MALDGDRCRGCGRRGHLEAHHLVPRGKLGRKHPDIDDPNNLIPLCHDCHQNHHTTAHRRVIRQVLREAEIQFIIDHANPNWLDIWYPARKEFPDD